jgi:hypothetical protein
MNHRAWPSHGILYGTIGGSPVSFPEESSHRAAIKMASSNTSHELVGIWNGTGAGICASIVEFIFTEIYIDRFIIVVVLQYAFRKEGNNMKLKYELRLSHVTSIAAPFA